jgi:hypothetical protein
MCRNPKSTAVNIGYNQLTISNLSRATSLHLNHHHLLPHHRHQSALLVLCTALPQEYQTRNMEAVAAAF